MVHAPSAVCRHHLSLADHWKFPTFSYPMRALIGLCGHADAGTPERVKAALGSVQGLPWLEQHISTRSPQGVDSMEFYHPSPAMHGTPTMGPSFQNISALPKISLRCM